MNGCVYKTEDGKCKKFSEPSHGITSWCIDAPCEAMTPSNEDRIKSMSTDELANFLEVQIWDLPWCDVTSLIDEETGRCEKWDCIKCCKEWLQKEAK